MKYIMIMFFQGRKRKRELVKRSEVEELPLREVPLAATLTALCNSEYSVFSCMVTVGFIRMGYGSIENVA